jgi:hypothetical protein
MVDRAWRSGFYAGEDSVVRALMRETPGDE